MWSTISAAPAPNADLTAPSRGNERSCRRQRRLGMAEVDRQTWNIRSYGDGRRAAVCMVWPMGSCEAAPLTG